MKLKLFILILSLYTTSLSSQNQDMIEFTIKELESDEIKNFFGTYYNGMVISAQLKEIVTYCSFRSDEHYEYLGKKNPN